MNLELFRALPPLPLPLPPLSAATLQIVTGPGVVIKLNGVTVWTIDEKLFGGTPVLTCLYSLLPQCEPDLRPVAPTSAEL